MNESVEFCVFFRKKCRFLRVFEKEPEKKVRDLVEKQTHKREQNRVKNGFLQLFCVYCYHSGGCFGIQMAF